MEEDIKILEEIKRPTLATGFERQTKILKAIENLIKGYRELEVITNGIKVLETNGVNDETFYVIAKTDFLRGSYKHLLDDYIPKTKVKEKIKELLEEKKYYYSDYKIDELNDKVQVLQELMEDK